MKVTLHLAISVDGFIAKPDGDSDWVAPTDEVLFMNRAKEAGCLVVGRKTFEQYRGKMYPVEGAVNIVLSRINDLVDPNILVATSPAKAIELARENGCTGILIAGGARVAGSFLEEGLVDEIFFSVHPLLLGQGMRVFDGLSHDYRLEHIGSKLLTDGLVELHYKLGQIPSTLKSVDPWD